MNILVVDDEQANLMVMRQFFEQEGLCIICAESGEEALLAIQEQSFVLLITDFYMDKMDGLELTQKALKVAPHLTVIMMTGDYSPEILRKASEAGITKVFAKPFDPRKMLETVRQVIENT